MHRGLKLWTDAHVSIPLNGAGVFRVGEITQYYPWIDLGFNPLERGGGIPGYYETSRMEKPDEFQSP